MGILDNVRNFFKSPNNSPKVQEDDSFKKSMLATKIVNLVYDIKRINSFDSILWNMNNVSAHQLQNKSLAELEKMEYTLSKRLSELTKQSQISSSKRESLEASKWTGQRPQNMSAHDFDRLQRDDGR